MVCQKGTLAAERVRNMYDYIIVGAGSAGCVLAYRLTQNPEISVLLLEAGGSDDLPEIHEPAAAPTLFHTAVDWDYFTEEEPHLHNRKLHWPRGKVLGGSSSINYTVYVRGHRHDYNRWQELGNTGWSYDDVLPYFKKAEDQERGASAYHGERTELRVANPLSNDFMKRSDIRICGRRVVINAVVTVAERRKLHRKPSRFVI
jgi:choline dehydrogenase